MFKYIRNRLNEKGSLPAIMAGAILVSSIAILLAGFSVTSTRNAEIGVAKASLTSAISSCESVLSAAVAGTLYSAAIPPLSTTATNSCNYPAINTTVRVIGTPTKYTAQGAPLPESVKVTLEATTNGVATKLSQTKYLKYAEYKEKTLTTGSYISSFDDSGNAIWVTP